jgi:hypothetical protein
VVDASADGAALRLAGALRSTHFNDMSGSRDRLHLLWEISDRWSALRQTAMAIAHENNQQRLHSCSQPLRRIAFMKPATFTGTLVLSLLAAGAAVAQAPSAADPSAAPSASSSATATATTPVQGTGSGADFATVDRNKDGRVSSAEASVNSELNTEFGKLDANHDSYLSTDEFAKWSKAEKPKSGMPADSSSPSPTPRDTTPPAAQ